MRCRRFQMPRLSSLFNHLDLPLAGNITDPDVDFSDPEVKARLFVSVNAFADYLLGNFFMPLKAATNKTPQLSPITHSAVQRAQGSSLPQSLAGTPERLSALRGTCLVRDRHRCVISRKFDVTEALRRRKAAPKDARDDDGSIIEPRDVTTLEVAHILPHSLTKAPDSLLSPARKAALDILNMFDMGIVHLIEGAEIDRPFNAITLSTEHHPSFGSFQIFFELVFDQPPNTYRIDAFDDFVGKYLGLPIVRTLYITETGISIPPHLVYLLSIAPLGISCTFQERVIISIGFFSTPRNTECGPTDRPRSGSSLRQN
ncbi:hypothetical protein RB597_007249 [Gaeumannomyces tritici]